MGTQVRELKAALIGLGFIGGVHLDALHRLGVQIVGALGSSPERTAAAAAAAGIPQVYADLTELVADDEVDVVHITSPNHAHAEQALALLRAGKHVVCEKPLAMTVEQAREMTAVAAESGLVAAVCFHNRWYPMSAQARSMVADGELGTPRLVLGHYLQDWLALETDWNWRLEPELGGETRAVGDIGSHWLDLVEYLTGDRIVEVFAEFSTFVPVRQQPVGPVQTFSTASGETREVAIATEDAALVLLRFASGARGQFTVSQVSQGHANQLRYEIAGSGGSVAWESEYPEELWIGHRGAPNQLLGRDPALMAPGATGWLPGGHPEGLPDAFTALFRAVYIDVAGGTPSERPRYATFADGLRGLVLEEAILSAARRGTWTKVE
ncbi:MAG: Gfo/Idh/MocA family oxidoreductase [Propionicimonas sp.]|uniref:Gfo/Idh/MocA family protein n=1 Tax=Propionicimonas sp. TaxID=1955623 RepID=UPI002B21E24B|nr:Gfo/Idh/MocA family oxidoreductase [Propionicimonas sp.]MEA4943318.1 Gfo/Idh/MocA family oxidoreductase [Propionicimonas sp.]